MKIAVFGHYDSRGGTQAMVLPDPPTADDVVKAIEKYANDNFEWGAQLAEIMADPRPDKGGWGPDPDKWTGPGWDDFMYVASIEGVPEGFTRGDLEDIGIVMIKLETEPRIEVPNRSISQRIKDLREGEIYEVVELRFVPYADGLSDADYAASPNPEVIQGRREAWIEHLHFENPGWEHRNWNDDAYGFWIGDWA